MKLHLRKPFATLVLILGLLIVSGPAAHAEIDAWPLLEISDRATTVLYPFYVNEPDFKMVFPFYYNTNEGKDRHYLWPLIKTSEGTVKRVAPVYFRGEESELSIFPLLFQNQNYTFWTVPPLAFKRDGDFSAVIPFYIRNREKLFIFPNIYWDSTGEKPVSNVVFPFYWFHESAESRTKIWFLMSGRKQTGNRNHVWAFPFFDYTRTYGNSEHWTSELSLLVLGGVGWGPDRSYRRILPIYWQGRTASSEYLWLLPYLSVSKAGYDLKMVLPLFARTVRPDGSNLWILNYYHSRYPDHRKTVFFPFFGSSEKSSGTRTWTSDWVLWPLYNNEKTFGADDQMLSRKRRFLFFSDEWTEDGSRVVRILGIPVRERVK